MSVAIPLITAGIKAGVSLWDAHEQSSASSAATAAQTAATLQAQKIQQQATADALAFQTRQEQYQEQLAQATQAARAPYLAAANGAVTKLSGLLGVPAPNFPSQSQMVAQQYTPPPMPQPNGGLTPRAPSLSQIGTPLTPTLGSGNVATGASATSPPQAVPTTEATVPMRAPDGTVQPVPQSQVAYYQSKGAQVVSA